MNKYRPDSEADIAILKVDNRSVRAQIDKIARFKAERNETESATAPLTRSRSAAATGSGNSLEGVD